MSRKLVFGIIIVLGLFVVFFGKNFPFIDNSIHAILDPSVGRLLDYNPTLGLVIFAVFFSLVISLVQKFTLNHAEIKRLKEEQKQIQQQMKEYKDHPEKQKELLSKQMESSMALMKLTMGSSLYTLLPMLLFFRWFHSYFSTAGVKIFGIFSWFWAYLIVAIIASLIFRKLLKLP